MALRPSPINWQIPIVDTQGRPTPEFLRQWQAQRDTNGTIPELSTPAQASAVLDVLAATRGALLVRGASQWGGLPAAAAGRVLTANGPLLEPSWQVPENISNLLDDISNVRGSVLYRGAAGWAALGPGTAGNVLQTNGAGADPSWVAGGGGGTSPGTPPVIVQVGAYNGASGACTVTLGVAPVSGHLLVAMGTVSASPVASAGWTLLVSSTSGAQYGAIGYKVAGGSEPVTQTPFTATGAQAIAMWELSGQAASPFIVGITQQASSAAYATTASLPGLTNVLALGAITGDNTTPAFTSFLNMTQDLNVTTGGGRNVVAGHSDATKVLAQALVTMSAAAATRNHILLVTS